MIMLNRKFLSKISEEYDMESVEMPDSGFLVYRLIHRKRKRVVFYLFLCKDFTISSDISAILDKISLWDYSFKNGNSYLCITPGNHAQIDMCTQFNGKSFLHFIIYDQKRNALIYDKDFYYHGSKYLKQLMDTYQNCFHMFDQKTV